MTLQRMADLVIFKHRSLLEMQWWLAVNKYGYSERLAVFLR